MRLINDDLPPILFEALRAKTYDHGDSWATVTSLNDAPRIRCLLKRHGDEIEQPASDSIFAFLGTALHYTVQMAEGDEKLKEERLFAEVGGKRISGQFDLYDGKTKTLIDLKIPSVWVWIFENGKVKPEWARQVQSNAWLLQEHGFEVERGAVLMVFRDWSPSEAKQQGSKYPAKAVQATVPLPSMEERRAYLEERVRLHAAAEALPDVELPMCTEVERWTKPTKFAVESSGRKSAHRVLDTYDEAATWMADNRKGEYIKPRPGEDTRCLSYCPVRSICSHGRAVAAAQNGTTDGE